MASYRFSGFVFDAEARELRRDGYRVPIQPQPLRILACLLDAPGELISREQLIEALWGDTNLADPGHSLNIAVRKLRAALGDSHEQPQLIETVARQGYRFIGELEREADEQVPTVEEVPVRPFLRTPALATAALALVSVGVWVWLLLGSWMPLRARAPLSRSEATSVDRVLVEASGIFLPRGSRDGRYFAYLCEDPWPRNAICMVDTVTGKARTVLQAPESNKARYWRPLASPDGQWIAYTWFADEKKELKGDLHVFRIGERAGRPLVTGSLDAKDYYSAVDWTGDGKAVLVATTNTHSSGLLLVPVNGSKATPIHPVDFDWTSGRDATRFSMDGKWIAYPAIKGARRSGGYRPTDVYVMPAAGGSPIAVATGGGSERVVGWLANGDLIVTSDRSGKTRPYRVYLSSGEQRSDLEPIDADVGEHWIVGVHPHDSSLFLFNQYRETDLHIFRTGSDKLRRFSNTYQGYRPAFSPDQKKLAYVSGSAGNQFLVVRDMASGEERRLPAAIPNVQSLAWYPDNRHVLAVCNDGDWTVKPTFRVDTQTGSIESKAKLIDQNTWFTPTILKDGKSLVITTRAPGREMGNSGIIQSLDLDSGRQRVLFQPRREGLLLGSYTVSSDRTRIVYAEHNLQAETCALLISPISRPEPRVLVEDHGDACRVWGPHFTPDDQTIVFWRGPSQLWKMSASEGKPELLREIEWSPDGPAFHAATGEILIGSGSKLRSVFRQKSIQARFSASKQ